MGSRLTERRFLLLVFGAGLLLRLLLLAARDDGLSGFYGAGEATRVALALARTGSFADAYYQGYGPTAHLLPISPGTAGALFWLFGAGSIPANLALLAWSLAQTFAAYLLLRRLAITLDMDPLAVRCGTALLCLLPVFAPQETIDFRYWEGASALALAALNLLLILHVDAAQKAGAPLILAAAALSALTFFLSPAAGLGTYACWALVALVRLGWNRALGLGAASAAALALLVAPWMLRNAAVMGTPIPLRSNFGLELAIANHPAAVNSAHPDETFAQRLLQVHPYHSPAARIALRAAGGESAYSAALGAEARAWIAAHPLAFVQLSATHLSEFFVPRPWQFHFSSGNEARHLRALIIGLASIVGLAGLAFGLARRRRGYWLLATYVALAASPYAIVQPVPRYSYIVWPLLVFLAAEAVVRARQRLRGAAAVSR
ncbi:hypothetical protein E5A73_15355 [Sphingomonas gei]|uniref:Glycosyltransferase RgtA/B/C/D-like domain-containing protein n=1 Tax=Sphingomonas gei TaxID=1395960 RepID=A0A4S1X7V0_9SPHN|nr:hypothetical protein [Sphingomonas gei]TGX52181.1 hypothetical protein E5A73_15355 [Sphingomonas gei]